jgi:alpha-galactosidase
MHICATALPTPCLLLFLMLCSGASSIGPDSPPVAGWSTWNTFACAINSSLVKQGADHLASSGLLASGYRYILSASM